LKRCFILYNYRSIQPCTKQPATIVVNRALSRTHFTPVHVRGRPWPSVYGRAHTCTYVCVVIEHVDFYGCTRNDYRYLQLWTCAHVGYLYAQTELALISAWCCVIFAAVARNVTQFHAVARTPYTATRTPPCKITLCLTILQTTVALSIYGLARLRTYPRAHTYVHGRCHPWQSVRLRAITDGA